MNKKKKKSSLRLDLLSHNFHALVDDGGSDRAFLDVQDPALSCLQKSDVDGLDNACRLVLGVLCFEMRCDLGAVLRLDGRLGDRVDGRKNSKVFAYQVKQIIAKSI